jgi:hypothetical protein
VAVIVPLVAIGAAGAMLTREYASPQAALTLPTGSADAPTLECGASAVDALVAALIIDRTVSSGMTLERCDRTALTGPWTVVVRRPGYPLGTAGAVVTYPVPAARAGRPVTVNGVLGSVEDGAVIWRLGAGYARVRGDVPEADLISIAAHTVVEAGRPAVLPLSEYAVVTTGPYRSPAIREVRYGAADLGESQWLGNGLVYTGLISGGGFEDQLYAVRASRRSSVHGIPAVVSPVLGGNATLAWEPIAGLVAYVGYSGAQLSDQAVAALQRLAGRTTFLSTGQWQATRPASVYQSNDPG